MRLQETELNFGHTNGRTDKRTDGRTNGWTDKRGSQNSYLDLVYYLGALLFGAQTCMWGFIFFSGALGSSSLLVHLVFINTQLPFKVALAVSEC